MTTKSYHELPPQPVRQALARLADTAADTDALIRELSTAAEESAEDRADVITDAGILRENLRRLRTERDEAVGRSSSRHAQIVRLLDQLDAQTENERASTRQLAIDTDYSPHPSAWLGKGDSDRTVQHIGRQAAKRIEKLRQQLANVTQDEADARRARDYHMSQTLGARQTVVNLTRERGAAIDAAEKATADLEKTRDTLNRVYADLDNAEALADQTAQRRTVEHLRERLTASRRLRVQAVAATTTARQERDAYHRERDDAQAALGHAEAAALRAVDATEAERQQLTEARDTALDTLGRALDQRDDALAALGHKDAEIKALLETRDTLSADLRALRQALSPKAGA